MPDPTAGLRLDGAVALVTGASRGLGAAVARLFASRGAALALVARDGGLLRNEARALLAAGAQEALPIPADLADPGAPARIADTVRSRFGRLTCLVNNAGRLGPRVPIADYPDAEWDATLAVNLSAPFRLVKACLPLLRAESPRFASIVNVSSGVGRTGKARWGAYAVTKFAIEGLTQVLAAETGGSGLVVLAINPGPLRTAMRAAAYPQEDPATVTPPEEVARVFLWAAAHPEARARHGASLDAPSLLAGWPAH